MVFHLKEKQTIIPNMFQRRIPLTFISISILFFCSPFVACEEESTDLTRAERIRVDSLVSRQTRTLRLELDSICDERFDRAVKVAMDSILQVRLKEIEAILNRK